MCVCVWARAERERRHVMACLIIKNVYIGVRVNLTKDHNGKRSLETIDLELKTQ